VEWPGGYEGFAATFAAREEEGNVRDLFSYGHDGTVNPGDLFEGVVEVSAARGWILASEPGGDVGREGTLERRGAGGCGAFDGDVESEEVHSYEPEPMYKGRTLSAWLRRYSQTSDRPDDNAAAADAVRHIGTNAIPYLLQWMDWRAPASFVSIDGALQNFPSLYRLWDVLGTVGFLSEIAFALEAAGGEAGKRVEHAEVIEGVGSERFAESLRAEIGDSGADLSGSELLSCLETGKAAGVAQQTKRDFLAAAAFLKDVLLAEIILIAPFVPGHDGAGADTFGIGTELFQDAGVGHTIVEHLVDAVADGFGAAGDVADAFPAAPQRIG